MIVISDASPLISLNVAGRLDLLEGLSDRVLIPRAVHREVIARWLGPFPDWIEILDPSGPPPDEVTPLDAGESAAITLALELGPALDELLMDDLAGRHVAEELGLPVLGLFGLLVEAKGAGLLIEVRPLLDVLIQDGARCSSALRAAVLRQAGEADAP